MPTGSYLYDSASNTISVTVVGDGFVAIASGTLDWGDGSSPEAGSVTGGGSGIEGSHVYALSGQYTVTATLTSVDDTPGGSVSFLVASEMTEGQWAIDGLLMGPGTIYPVDVVEGLIGVTYKDQDRDLGPVNGDTGGSDFLAPRELIMAVGINADAYASEQSAAIQALSAVMRPRTSDITIRHVRFLQPWIMFGRPRGFEVPWDDGFHFGLATTPLKFKCSDPRIYLDGLAGVPGNPNGGDLSTYPFITLTDFSGTVTVSVGGADLILDTTLTDATQIVLDYRRKTIRTGSGGNLYRLVDPASVWGVLEPGDDSVAVSGATAVSVIRYAFSAFGAPGYNA